jgi:release factor glutamine methyltransferase
MRAAALDAGQGGAATVRDALATAAALLAEAGVETARGDAEWLLAEALALPRGRLGLEARRPLDAAAASCFAQLVRRRMTREPLQHIVGTQPFRQITVRVSADALVPRPETEALAGWALELLPAAARVVDVGTGTGCIACAIAAERPDARVVALDLSPAAVALARANVAALGLSARVGVAQSDLLAALAPRVVDVIVSNPPYLPAASIATLAPEVSRWDPRLALDGGPDGLDVIRRLVVEAPDRLAPGGALVVETAGGGQLPVVVALMRAAGLGRVRTRADLAGVERFVAGGRD